VAIETIIDVVKELCCLVFLGTFANASELSARDLRSDVRVLAARRVESTQFPRDTFVSAAQEFRF